MTKGHRDCALLVSTWLPQASGQGTAIRAHQLLHLLLRRYAQVSLLLACGKSANDPAIQTLRDAHPQLDLRLIDARLDVAGQRAAAARHLLNGSEGWARVLVYRSEAAYLLSGTGQGDVPWWLDIDELASQREQGLMQLATAQGEAARAGLHRSMAVVCQLIERGQYPRYRQRLICSSAEAAQLARVHGMNAAVLSNSFPATAPLPPRPPDGVLRLLFVGVLSYLPNEAAVRWLAAELAPAIRTRLGGAVEFTVVGAGASAELIEIIRNAGLLAAGFVPELRDAYAAADAVLVPIRHGTGVRMKILEAFAHGRAVISTRKGAEGLAVRSGCQLLLAEDAVAFAEAAESLHRQPALGTALVANALELLHAEHSEAALDHAWDQLEHAQP